jgi:hypothetical protein
MSLKRLAYDKKPDQEHSAEIIPISNLISPSDDTNIFICFVG